MLSCFIAAVLSVARAEEDLRPRIWVRGSYDSAVQLAFPPERFQYHNRASREREEREEGYLPPAERDALFAKLGIARKLASADELTKDLLVLEARESSARELRKFYPMLNLNELERLKAALSGGGQ